MVFVLCVGGGRGHPLTLMRPSPRFTPSTIVAVCASVFCLSFFFSSTIEFQLYMFLKIKLPRRVFVYCVFYSSFFVRISIIVVIAVSI